MTRPARGVAAAIRLRTGRWRFGRGFRAQGNSIAVLLLPAMLFAAAATCADDRVQLDPFAQATQGFPGCPERTPPLLTPAQARAEAHARAERGTRCAMEGTCEAGGAYKRDPEINERVRDALAHAPQFAGTTLWVTTTRRWAILSGCVRNTSQRRALVAFTAGVAGVERVFDETGIGVAGHPKRP